MSTLTEKARESVLVLHEQIAAVFNGNESQLTPLLSHFDPDFVMVTPTGKSLAMPEVAALFARLVGGRQGLHITIEQCQTLAQFGQEVAIQYHERQQQGENHTHRISLAVINCGVEPPRWRYLQETMVTN
ncbi:hypothetical protein [Erwinia persicina]|uniref:hypothetical protein n=1 Tax=Erwinia persicina TaxID=55211 RepID=UPI00078824F9|nr:hypothetical protein [Erwinia persicina]